MIPQEIKNLTGMVIGHIYTLEGGTLELRNIANEVVGTYNPYLNQTFNALGYYYGPGNLLHAMLY